MTFMGGPRVEDFRVAMDYGQFYLYSRDDIYGDDFDTIEVVTQASSEGIAERDGFIVVSSPHQNNFDMRLRVEVWPERPPFDLDDWQEAFAASLQVGPTGLTYDSPTLTPQPVRAPTGHYRLLIVGRGFVARGWPGSTTPGDEWRLQMWPDETTTPARRLRTWTWTWILALRNLAL